MSSPNSDYRLTRAATFGGCAAKVPPGKLAGLMGPLAAIAGLSEGVLVGPHTGDDAGAFSFHGRALLATTDFIPPVCDDPVRYGRIAATNAISDIYAMGGRPLFALNLCLFPEDAPAEILAGILAGGADAMARSGTALLGGHSIRDREPKYGLAVVGDADPDRLFTNAAARPGDRLLLTKPLGTGVMVNAFRSDKISEDDLDPALTEMERLNDVGSRRALAHGVRAATDVTGFGLGGHAARMARESGVGMRIRFAALPVHAAFFDLVARGVSTGCTRPNRDYVGADLLETRPLGDVERELIFDPQTSGGLLIAAPAGAADALLAELLAAGHRAAEIGEVVAGASRLEIV
jgi:selenide,water dikinase